MDSLRSSRRSFRQCLSACFRAHALELMQTAMWVVFAALAVASMIGCERAVFVPEASPMRIGPSSKTRVYMMVEGNWVLSSNAVEIPEGWYIVPPSYVSEEEPK